jgi:molecular chaperone DnaJ
MRCPACNGSGELRQVRQTFLGSMVNVTTCPTCQGKGETIATPCSTCNGRTQVRQTRRLSVNIPPGVDSGTQIRLSGEGEPGLNGGPNGNLYVVLTVEPHRYFRRQGDDIVHEVAINVAEAALGTDIVVQTVNGQEKIKVPSGTQPGTVFHLRGKGVPHLQRSGRGDMYVVVTVAMPASLSGEQKRLLKDLAKTLPGGAVPQERGLIDRIRDVLLREG